MKYKFILFLTALVCLVGVVPASDAGLVINIGDRGFYTRGHYYYEGGRRWNWVPGHWSWRHHHRVWIHGHYRPI